VIMPPVGMILGRIDFKDLFISLNGHPYDSLTKAKAAAAPVLAYGQFLNTVITLLIVALVIFLSCERPTNFTKRRCPRPRPRPHRSTPPPAAPTTQNCPSVLHRYRFRRDAAPTARPRSTFERRANPVKPGNESGSGFRLRGALTNNAAAPASCAAQRVRRTPSVLKFQL